MITSTNELRKALFLLGCFAQFLLFASCKKGAVTYIDEDVDSVVVIDSGALMYKNIAYNPGDTIYGYNNYIKLVVGDRDCPLLLGVPHDGISTGNPVIPETGTTGRDLNTKPLATSIATAFKNQTSKQPWIIINEIGRKRVDPNTYPNEVSQRYTDTNAVNTYNSYHELLQLARATIAASSAGIKGALFLDIHGHAHQYVSGHTEPYTSILTGNSIQSAFIDQTEVGYGLSNYSLEQSDAYLDGLADSASIHNLTLIHPNTAFSEMIRGSYSFGGLLHAQSIRAVPGSVMQILDRNATLFGTTYKGKPERRPYFNGGYCTRKYGTIVKGSTVGFNDNIAAIQIETPGITVRNNPSIIAVSGPKIKRAIINYLNYWYSYSFANNL